MPETGRSSGASTAASATSLQFRDVRNVLQDVLQKLSVWGETAQTHPDAEATSRHPEATEEPEACVQFQDLHLRFAETF